MAASSPSVRLRRAASLLSGVLFAAAPGHAATHDARAPIELEAASSEFDYRNDTLLFRRVKITQAGLQVEARQASATGLNFENSQWNLEGEVRITLPEGRLASDEATVTFRNNEIVRAVVLGSPATFEQRLEGSGQLAQGRSQSIEYDVANGTARLVGDAWLSDGQNEIRGRTLVYDIGRQRVAANPDEADPGGVRITIRPQGPATPPAPPAEREP